MTSSDPFAFSPLVGESAESVVAAGLPPLAGSEKQVRWAETIRREKLADITEIGAVIARAESAGRIRAMTKDEVLALREASLKDLADMGVETSLRDALRRRAMDILVAVNTAARFAAFVAVLSRKTQAAFWIDFRAHRLDDLANVLAGEIDAEIEAATPIPPEEVELAQAVMTEALLKPAGEPKSQQIAEIRLVGNELRVVSPEKIDEFRTLMRELGYVWVGTRWTGAYWSRKLGVTTGDTVDRLAETAHRIVGAGFMARLYDEEARNRALGGNFTAEQTRWVTLRASGDFSGWFQIHWRKPDDFYAPAKRILGSRYKAGGQLFVPVSSAEEVVDFAEEYDFLISPGAREAIDKHRAALAAGHVVTNTKKTPEAMRVTAADVPPKLKPDADAHIAPELMDGD